jgi:nucleoside-diphosphate-sugar epimerase
MNVACGERYSLNDLVRELSDLLSTSVAPRYAPPREGDVKHSLADITRAKELLGFRPRVDFREGLRRTVAHFRKGDAR